MCMTHQLFSIWTCLWLVLLGSNHAAQEAPRPVLKTVEKALNAGASGVCMGRQVFAHPNPGAMAKALVMMVHEGASAASAMSAVGL